MGYGLSQTANPDDIDIGKKLDARGVSNNDIHKESGFMQQLDQDNCHIRNGYRINCTSADEYGLLAITPMISACREI
ncbi:MAG: hypothetical protein K1566_11940 [Candidatus Thiodiazotropha sp. (ex. Lucinisca nassula)]|nr:hypothetical protein [Candidatus Thiodiazotropha sp. (ex. Lucinisca nassula)]